MQRIENMQLGDGIIGAAASAIVTWLVASVTKVSKSEFKELVARVANLERDRIPREEFDRRVDKLEDLVKEFRSEMRAEMKDIKVKVS